MLTSILQDVNRILLQLWTNHIVLVCYSMVTSGFVISRLSDDGPTYSRRHWSLNNPSVLTIFLHVSTGRTCTPDVKTQNGWNDKMLNNNSPFYCFYLSSQVPNSFWPPCYVAKVFQHYFENDTKLIIIKILSTNLWYLITFSFLWWVGISKTFEVELQGQLVYHYHFSFVKIFTTLTL